MAIMIREFVENGKNFAKKVSDYKSPISLTEGAKVPKSDVNALDPESLMVEIEGIHAIPFATRNFTRYTPKCLKESIPSWTNPYRRPLLKHHNEENGEPIGRIIAAEYKTRDTNSGTPALCFTVNVPDDKAKEGIKNGLLSTTSVGVIARDVRCSICGAPITDIEEGCPNGHERGTRCEKNDGTTEVCYWDIHEMEAKELSYVDVPSDMYSKNIDYYPVKNKKSGNQPQIKESLDPALDTKNKGEQHMPDDMKAQLDEAIAKASKLETKVAELTEANKASEGKIAELSESVKNYEAQIAELTEQKSSLEVAAKEAAELKESMEQEIASAKTALKESMTDTFVTLREALGETVENVDSIKERPVEALKYSILDMKESLSKKMAKKQEELKHVDPKDAGSVQSPGLGGDPEFTESHTAESIDLKEGLANIFGSVMSAHK